VFSKITTNVSTGKEGGSFREDLDPDLFYLVLITAMQGIMNPQVLSQQSFSAERSFQGNL